MNMIFRNGYDESHIEVTETSLGYVVSIEYTIMDYGTGNRIGVVERDSFTKSFIKKEYSSEKLVKDAVVDYIICNAWGGNQYYIPKADILAKLGWSE